MSFRATAHHPDGSVICHPGAWKHKPGEPGVPIEYVRDREERAVLSANRAWWHPKSQDPAKSEPPVGATIQVDGVTSWRWDRIPVFNGAGEVISTKLGWVDVLAEVRAVEAAKALEEARAKHAASIAGVATRRAKETS